MFFGHCMYIVVVCRLLACWTTVMLLYTAYINTRNFISVVVVSLCHYACVESSHGLSAIVSASRVD